MTQRPPCVIAEKRDPSCCGNGITESGFEECDDGNHFDGDGCSSVCTHETLVTTQFEPLLVYVTHLGVSAVHGSISFTKAFSPFDQDNIVAVRRFQLEPTGTIDGTFCMRGVVPEDRRYGPGNVGHGLLSFLGASPNILAVTVFVQQWVDPLEAGTVDFGPDGIPCTDDDPGLTTTTVLSLSEDLKLALPPSCSGDANADGQVTIDEILSTVDNALGMCPNPLIVPPQSSQGG